MKELQTELRTKSGLLTAGLFSVVTIVALAFASFGKSIDPAVASGIVWVALLFAAVVALPRAFVAEEEQGTGELLRMIAPPAAVFWGKALFNLLLMVVTGLALAGLYATLAELEIKNSFVFMITVMGGCAALSGTVTLCGALVAQAQNRGMLAGAIALPLLVPFVFLGVSAMRLAFGEGQASSGWVAVCGVWLYAVATSAIGPIGFEQIWKA